MHDVTPERFNRYVFIVIAGTALLYGALNPQYRTGVLNDDAVYVISAHDLLSSTPLQTYAQRRPDFPFPGLPLLLSPLAQVVDPHWSLLEWVSVLTTLLAVFLLAQWTKRWMSPQEGLFVTALFALNPIVAKFSGIVMPSPYLVAGVMASFLLLSLVLERPTTLNRLGLSAVLCWVSVLRPEGILLLASIAGGFVWSRRWKDLFRTLSIPLMCWSLYAFHIARASQTLSTEYGSDLASLLAYWPRHRSDILWFSHRFLRDLFFNAALGIPTSDPIPAWAGLLILVPGVFLIGMGFRRFWEKGRLPHTALVSVALFCSLHFALHVFWRVAIPRYGITLLPFLFIFLVHGTTTWSSLFPRRTIWRGALLLPFIFSYGYANAQAVYQSLWAPDPMNAPPWKAMDWLAHHTPPEARCLSPVAPSLTLYARRPSLSMLEANNAEDFLSRVLKIHLTYIVDRNVLALTPGVSETEDPNRLWDRIRFWVYQYPARFPLVLNDPVEKVAIYRIIPERGFSDAYDRYIAAVQDLQAGREQKALKALRQSQALDPALGTVMNAFGFLSLSHNDLPGAKRYFLKSIQVMPDSTIALLNLASVYFLQGNLEASTKYFKRGLRTSADLGEQDQFLQRARILQSRHQIELPPPTP